MKDRLATLVSITTLLAACAGFAFLGGAAATSDGMLEAAEAELDSKLSADYGADQFTYRLPALSVEIIDAARLDAEALSAEARGGGEADEGSRPPKSAPGAVDAGGGAGHATPPGQGNGQPVSEASVEDAAGAQPGKGAPSEGRGGGGAGTGTPGGGVAPGGQGGDGEGNPGGASAANGR